MTIETYINPARTRVRAEQDRIEAKITAFETFRDRVATLSTEASRSPSPGITATAGTYSHGINTHDNRCRAVRTAFAETIRPHGSDDIEGQKSLLATIRTELNDSIAIALAPTAKSPFTNELKRAIVDEVNTKRTRMTVTRRALDREAALLDDTTNTIDEITEWITTTNETPLLDLGFEALRNRHEQLATFRTRCEERIHERQAFLHGTTRRNADAGVRHWSLVTYLYTEFPMTFPVLTTLVRLDETCLSCQRTIRGHLVRRV